MIELTMPRGLAVQVPETIDEGPTMRFRRDQPTAKAERHALNEKGWVMNPISASIPGDMAGFASSARDDGGRRGNCGRVAAAALRRS